MSVNENPRNENLETGRTVGGRLRRLAVAVVATLAFAVELGAAPPAHAIVNGTSTDASRYRAVVSVYYGTGQCSGTFVHPRFVLTAAHCVNFQNDGPPQAGTSVWDGQGVGTGARYQVDRVYLARAGDLGRSVASDVAILRTTVPFRGTPIPVMDRQDRPRPDSTYCTRWEYTWPGVGGYSDNANTQPAERRIGRAFAECDIEIDGTVFKLDGHGRSQTGVRTCPGDSGGPVLWGDGFGGYGVGGVNSRTDKYRYITDTRCPSDRGEGYHAFVPTPFLDRVASTDSVCAGATRWEGCPGSPSTHNGLRLQYLGTRIEQCGASSVTVPSPVKTRSALAGETVAVEVGSDRFAWYCGSAVNYTSGPAGTELVISKRAWTDRQLIFDAYRILERGTPSHPATAEYYASVSVAQNRQQVANLCGLEGALWHSDHLVHENWGSALTPQERTEVIAERAAVLQRCGVEQPIGPNQTAVRYAVEAVDQNAENLQLGCGGSGNRWSSDYLRHHAWAYGAPPSVLEDESLIRLRFLEACMTP